MSVMESRLFSRDRAETETGGSRDRAETETGGFRDRAETETVRSRDRAETETWGPETEPRQTERDIMEKFSNISVVFHSDIAKLKTRLLAPFVQVIEHSSTHSTYLKCATFEDEQKNT
jgi:hypothetical protein